MTNCTHDGNRTRTPLVELLFIYFPCILRVQNDSEHVNWYAGSKECTMFKIQERRRTRSLKSIIALRQDLGHLIQCKRTPKQMPAHVPEHDRHCPVDPHKELKNFPN